MWEGDFKWKLLHSRKPEDQKLDLICEDQEEFPKEVTSNLVHAPDYFAQCVSASKVGEILNLEHGNIDRAKPVSEFKELVKDPQTVILDSRSLAEFHEGHIPNSLLVPLTSNFLSTLLMLSPKSRKFFL